MTPGESVDLVETFWDEVWAACNPDAIDRFVTDDFVITTAGVDVAGLEDLKTWVAGFQSTISDLKWETIEFFSTSTAHVSRRVFGLLAGTTACSGYQLMASQ